MSALLKVIAYEKATELKEKFNINCDRLRLRDILMDYFSEILIECQKENRCICLNKIIENEHGKNN